jgi:hypothetical protein
MMMVNSTLLVRMKQHESSKKHCKSIPVVTDFKKNETKKVVVFEVDEEIVLL